MFDTNEIVDLCKEFARKAKLGNVPSNKKVWSNSEKPEFKKTCLYFDSDNSFAEFFDNSTGYTLTTNILKFKPIPGTGPRVEVIDTGIEPVSRNFPELLDIGIMGHCTCANKCKINCYQSAALHNTRPNMSFEIYKSIIDQVKDRTYEIALGGSGNPNDHEDFEKILKYTVDSGLVPNYTTASILDEKQLELSKKYCGAVAVSWHPGFYKENENGDWTTQNVKPLYDWSTCQDYTEKSIENLKKYGVKTNIHYVLSKESLAAAIDFLNEPEGFGKGINAVIFLRYKPVGLGKVSNCLDENAPDTEKFFEAVDNWINKSDVHKVGFDSCTVPLIQKFCKKVNDDSCIPCEGCRRSAYISPDGKLLPCSFGNQDKSFYFDGTIEDFWKSKMANDFRARKCCPWIK